jgi:signal transduction histidine kinase
VTIRDALAPARDWIGLDPGGHSVQFYADDLFLLEGLARYVGGALGAGDSAVVIATEAHRDGLARQLGGRGLSLDLAAAQGRYVALDAAETLARFMRDGQPDAARFAGVVGPILERANAAARGERPRVAAYGEMVALLWADGNPAAAIRLEQLWNELARTHAFTLHCAYPLSLFAEARDAELIASVCAHHSHVVPAESYTTLPDEGQRLQAIALLQQKARALETEVEERRRAEERLRDALASEQACREENERLYQQAQSALQLRDQFLSAIAHDLKTPLAGIKGGAQLLQRRATRGALAPERLAADLGDLAGCATRMSRMVEQLVDLARIQAGRPPELEIKPTDLVGLAERMAAEHQRTTDRHEIRVECDAPRLVGRWDPARLERVLDNLLGNAVKYSPRGGRIVVRVRREDADTALLEVSDPGVGIPPADLARIFDQFHRGANVAGSISGTGIGLASAQQVVALHGGSIDVDSQEARGSTFTVRLPLGGAEDGDGRPE